jgi:uncharacterized membrane protein (DUF485 family)|tara:strand:+ start:285 stop:554 length:270 start_codon:yes stop_codon:yes gene_type:complete
MKINKRNLKESMADTAIALPIAWATSYISLLLMISFGVKDALLISAVQTLILTVVSVVRKYCVRTVFSKRDKLILDRLSFDLEDQSRHQ